MAQDQPVPQAAFSGGSLDVLLILGCFEEVCRMSRRRGETGFIKSYAPDDRYLLKPDRAHGRAGILRGRMPTSSHDVLIKVWPIAKGGGDQDLEVIWRSEIRQLHRIAAVPGADDLFVHMAGSGKDSNGFYLVLDPGRGSPLQVFLDAQRRPDLLTQARQPRAKRLLWSNILRLAQGLELLHSQGSIHRNVDPWSVVTAFGDEPDFRLTGFEWSMRIAAIDSKDTKKIKAPRTENSFSFARDWRDLAHLAAIILDVPIAQVSDIRIIPSRVAEHVSAAEVRLLRTMLGIDRVERLDGEYIGARITEIIDGLAAEAAGKEAALCIAVRLGSGSGLSEAIRKASGNEIEIADELQQIRFMRDDLGDKVQLIALKDHQEATTRYALQGQRLTYRLASYRRPGSSDVGTWEFAYTERADSEAPSRVQVVGDTTFAVSMLEILRNADATQSFPRRRGRVQHWEDYLRRTEGKLARKSDPDLIHEAFSLLLLVEMGFAAADVFPIQITSTRNGESADQKIVYLMSRHDTERAELSQQLGLDAPATRLKKLLGAEAFREEGGWTLSETGTLGERSTTSTTWRFLDYEDVEDVECMKFEGPAFPQHGSSGFLVPAGMVGRIAQFKRRLKALAALKEHGELLRMFVDPRLRLDNSQDPLDERDTDFQNLDASKQAALREILATIPLFLLQGPPGVGKTYLVGDLVRRRFEDDPIARMLLSAQSNSAIDHLMKEVQGVFATFAEEARPLMVRARPADDDDSAGELEIDVQADRRLQDLSTSPLVRAASEPIARKIMALAEARRTQSGSQHGSAAGSRRISADLRAFEGMLLRAANLVFATTNSAAVDRLIEEQALFDWTIIEEAGKATGGELLSPLLLSHRRLMIGDHKQLPPFDVDTISKFLSSTENVRQVIGMVDDLVSRYLKDQRIDETLEEIASSGENLGRTCAEALSLLTLFQTYVERELARQKKRDQGMRIARRLNEQYRMHPAIARIVSTSFYDGELRTNARQEAKFLSMVGPVYSLDASIFPDIPIVFVDMPFGRAEAPNGRSGERAPPWWNPDESAAVIRVLELMGARDEARPSLAVLSPYWQQVRRIEKLIAQHRDGRLAGLAKFNPAIDGQAFSGTVDSFQGGEADMVVVSLVRNNHHTSPARALGFLQDNRRMNVLLSRAKWRLVVVGSLQFYHHVIESAEKLPDQNVGFLSTFLTSLKEEEKLGNAAIVPWATLKGAAS